MAAKTLSKHNNNNNNNGNNNSISGVMLAGRPFVRPTIPSYRAVNVRASERESVLSVAFGCRFFSRSTDGSLCAAPSPNSGRRTLCDWETTNATHSQFVRGL